MSRNRGEPGDPKTTWREAISKYLTILNIDVELVSNRGEWQKRIHTADPSLGL